MTVWGCRSSISHFRERSRIGVRDDGLMGRHTHAKLFEKDCRISVSPIGQDPSVTRFARASSPFRGAKTAQLIFPILASPERGGEPRKRWRGPARHEKKLIHRHIDKQRPRGRGVLRM